MANTNTLQRALNFVQPFVLGNPLSGLLAIANEPALSIGDWVRQFILGPPFSWRWNRAQTAFIAKPGVQDYVVTFWQANTAYALYTIVVDINGNEQLVTTAGTSGASQPVWNPATNATTADGGTLVWTNQGAVGVSTPLQNFGWLEKATWSDGTNFQELQVALNLGEDSKQNPPVSISARLDNNNGIITFRLLPVPDVIYTVTLAYQKSAPNFATLSDLWQPIPDYLSYLYNQGMLSKCYELINDEKTAFAMQLFVRQVIAANEGLSDSQKNIFIDDWLKTQKQIQDALGKTQEALQGRGMF